MVEMDEVCFLIHYYQLKILKVPPACPPPPHNLDFLSTT